MMRQAYLEAFKAFEIGQDSSDDLSTEDLNAYYEVKYMSIQLMQRSNIPNAIKKGL